MRDREEKNMYPANDSEFETTKIAKVEGDSTSGWSIQRADGWSFFVPADSPIEPVVGMSARFYGKGIGGTVRGLFLDGQQVYYRTAAEDEEYSDIQLYGVDAADWLKRWDEGKGVWSIEMGGIGPGYEQCIQITTAEALRVMLDRKFDHTKWTGDDTSTWTVDRDEIDKVLFDHPEIAKLGLSGAQHGAALNLASQLYRIGPRGVMKIDEIKDRHIQVSRTFPGAA